MKRTTVKKFIPQKEKNMNLNRLLSSKGSSMLIITLTDIGCYFVVTYLMNFVNNLGNISQAIRTGENTSDYLNLRNIIWYTGSNKLMFFFFFFVFVTILDAYMYYKLIVSYSEKYFNINQKGMARWTTIEEIKQQYKEIPEKDIIYRGNPGTIVAHFDGKLYIDTNINNTLVIGITRSGKGEMYIFPSIDVYSRAENKHSLIVCDPKMENYKSSKKTLENRGYDVYLLNLDNPLYSMGYNPLTLVIKFFKQGQDANAYSMARTFAYSIFHANENNNSEPIWKNTATDLFTALIIAVTKDLLALDEALNEMRMQAFEMKKIRFHQLSEEDKEKIRNKTKEWISEGIDIAADTRVNEIPEEIPFEYVNPHEKQIYIYNIIILFTELVRVKNPDDPNMSALDDYFNKRPLTDLAKLKYATIESAGYRTKGSVYTNMLSYLGTFIDENIGKMTAESSINLEDVGFGEKPIAIFIGTPDYDKSSHFIVSVLIRQLYFILSKRAVNAPNQKCKRPVRFILDEFGIMPAIEAMDELITVGNGKNIGFDLYVQSYAQIHKIYGDDAQTIIDNCANEVFIKSGDDETLEKLSKLLGTQTYIDVQRTGHKLSLKKTYMETPAEKPLMREDELMGLKEGECIVTRKLKRKDNRGKDIELTPIFNSIRTGTSFPFRHMYLKNSFPDPDTIPLKSVNQESREYIDLEKRVININEITKGIDQQIGMMPEITKFRDSDHFELIDKKLREVIGDDYMSIIEIHKDSSMARVLSAIENTPYLKENTKIAIRSIVSN